MTHVGESTPFRAIAGLFLAVFSVYALTGPGHLGSVDGTVLLASARNLLQTGSMSVPPDPSEHSQTITPRGTDGRAYPLWGPGLVLAHLPTLFLARHLELFRPLVQGRRASSVERDKFYAPFTCAWLMAAAVACVALSGSALGFPFRSSLMLAALMAFGSPLWHYARFDTNEALQCAALIGATACLLRGRSALEARHAVFSGALLGVAVAAKALNVIVLPWFFLYTAWSAASRSRVRVLVWMAAPLFVIGTALAALNTSRYGSPFETGYHLTVGLFSHSLLDGAWVLLFSPGFGLVVFCPAFLLLPFAGLGFLRRFPRETALIASVFVSHLFIDSKFYAYWGCAWGPRFLVPALPLLSLLLLPWIAERGWRSGLVISAFLIGIAVQTITIPAAFWGQIIEVWGRLAVPVAETSTEPAKVAVQQTETLVHASSATPPRIALWLLENTHCRGAGEPPPPLTTPPWAWEFPWQEAESEAELAGLIGLDLWVAPPCWRPQAALAVLPGNPRLGWLLLAVAVAGVGLIGSGWRRAPERTEAQPRSL